ncbi:serine hydrolase domain-containing protein [Aspergillus homomorphus CBS 101889]|uniref:Beta-lactamase n=1 Tax=Aspergillus homomorphus (strain CBS 101889) TaxID=1450537 RepID=A0A395HK34_ASPHC|nr:beta-lactamase [Aspergillus homomorphus CBS 101889]RAL08292.1 beta-lactamase [Aspergillus homomorphus CBS 101889]
MTTIHGTNHPAFASVRETFANHIASGVELGAALCVSVNGETVVDLWGGSTTTTSPKPWEHDTVVPVWSLTKLVTALSTLLLIDRKQLDPFAPVTQYWPAFRASQDIEVRHLLSHSSGLSGWDTPPSPAELYDLGLTTAKLITQEPWWTPGSASGYHMLTQGWLLGGLIREVTGQASLSEFIKSELTRPLNVEDGFYLRIPEQEWPRIAELVPPPNFAIPALDPASVAMRTFLSAPLSVASAATAEFRLAEMGASDGFGNARALNKILSVVSLGGVVDGKRFLSPETVELIFQPQVSGVDLVLGEPVTFGVGMALARPLGPEWLPDGRRVGYWTGWGGSLGLMDAERGVTVTYTMNKMADGLRENGQCRDYVAAVYEALEGYLAGL